jgi:hypothetical protein
VIVLASGAKCKVNRRSSNKKSSGIFHLLGLCAEADSPTAQCAIILANVIIFIAAPKTELKSKNK